MYTIITQVGWQIIDPDPGLNFNAAMLTGDLLFEIEKSIYLRNRKHVHCFY